jgi:hypothetical protein
MKAKRYVCTGLKRKHHTNIFHFSREAFQELFSEGRKKVVAANGNLLKQFSSTRVALLWELPELQRGTM